MSLPISWQLYHHLFAWFPVLYVQYFLFFSDLNLQSQHHAKWYETRVLLLLVAHPDLPVLPFLWIFPYAFPKRISNFKVFNVLYKSRGTPTVDFSGTHLPERTLRILECAGQTFLCLSLRLQSIEWENLAIMKLAAEKAFWNNQGNA